MNLDLRKTSGPDCIPVMGPKNCESELSYILAELFNKCLKESCFPDCWKVSSMVPLFKSVGERSTAKNYHLNYSLLSLVSKVLEERKNNSSMVLALLNQLQIFSQLYLIELLQLLTGLRLLKL